MIYILDTETTDSDPKTCEVIELAYVGFSSLRDILEAGTWPIQTSRFWPSRPMAYGALATHHILLEDLEGCPRSDTAQVPNDCDYLIGHNIDFDWEVLGAPAQVKRIDTIAMMRDMYPLLDSHKLSACVYFLSGANSHTRDRLQNAHSADVDIALCAEVLQHICAEKSIEDIESLYTYSEEARTPKIMSFGKHKGEPVSDVPYGYIKWYRSQPDTDPYLIEAFRRVTDAQYKGR
jgi:exodeoxyribonuclease X